MIILQKKIIYLFINLTHSSRDQPSVIYLQSDIITETYRRERYKTVIKAIEITPALVSRKHCSTCRNNYT